MQIHRTPAKGPIPIGEPLRANEFQALAASLEQMLQKDKHTHKKSMARPPGISDPLDFGCFSPGPSRRFRVNLETPGALCCMSFSWGTLEERANRNATSGPYFVAGPEQEEAGFFSRFRRQNGWNLEQSSCCGSHPK